ncbi:hypothetical protein [Desulfosporosinus lacus]|uniref:Uncharacterized protein n=1 Tax=Desulfosporosinus lacus DSM 15449 TaxID=1121420 RepID=A0A1M5V9B1_9FIRM|nr:hypothetical protein [Desulfosporosinus lacus]SHH71810.1 hypothetical protein SAMN02746098_01260 [Desulfosporosinus lacus DSM 15449]
MTILKSKKIKSILTGVLAVFLTLSLSGPVFASTNNKDAATQKFSKDTIITTDNAKSILKAYGIDPNTGVKSDKPIASVKTVADLEIALEEGKKLPSKIIDNVTVSPLPLLPSSLAVINAISYETRTTTTKYTSTLSVIYSASGQHYTYGEEAWWTSAGSGSITPKATGIPGTFYQVTEQRRLSNQVYNANTMSSYLQLSYDYDITHYVTVAGFTYPTSSSPIQGSVRFTGVF